MSLFRANGSGGGSGTTPTPVTTVSYKYPLDHITNNTAANMTIENAHMVALVSGGVPGVLVQMNVHNKGGTDITVTPVSGTNPLKVIPANGGEFDWGYAQGRQALSPFQIVLPPNASVLLSGTVAF